MSREGLNKVAKIFSDMQQLRIKLLENVEDKQNIRLGQLLETGLNSMKEKFTLITLLKHNE